MKDRSGSPPEPHEQQEDDGVLGFGVEGESLVAEARGGLHMSGDGAGGDQIDAEVGPDGRERHEERRLQQRQQTQQHHTAQRSGALSDQTDGQSDALPHEADHGQPQDSAASQHCAHRLQQRHLLSKH